MTRCLQIATQSSAIQRSVLCPPPSSLKVIILSKVCIWILNNWFGTHPQSVQPLCFHSIDSLPEVFMKLHVGLYTNPTGKWNITIFPKRTPRCSMNNGTSLQTICPGRCLKCCPRLFPWKVSCEALNRALNTCWPPVSEAGVNVVSFRTFQKLSDTSRCFLTIWHWSIPPTD